MAGRMRLTEAEAKRLGLIPELHTPPEPERPKYDGTWYRQKMAEIKAGQAEQPYLQPIHIPERLITPQRLMKVWVCVLWWVIGFMCGTMFR